MVNIDVLRDCESEIVEFGTVEATTHDAPESPRTLPAKEMLLEADNQSQLG